MRVSPSSGRSLRGFFTHDAILVAGAGDNTLTVECTSSWDVYDEADPTTLWHAGIIFDEIPGLGTNTYFCHHIVMDTSGEAAVMKMWETYWTYGEDYSCPETLRALLDGELAATMPSGPLMGYLTGLRAGSWRTKPRTV